ncbi:MAG: hypothetical protein AABX75_01340 [Nanoarchaeota archaeon]
MVSEAYRAVRYSAFASVALENAPACSKDLAGKIAELFDIAFSTVALNNYLRIRAGKPFYEMLACEGRTQHYFRLKPEFYACLQKAITQGTGRQPADGAAWLAACYKRNSYHKPTPSIVFEEAAKKFNRQNSKTKTRVRQQQAILVAHYNR